MVLDWGSGGTGASAYIESSRLYVHLDLTGIGGDIAGCDFALPAMGQVLTLDLTFVTNTWTFTLSANNADIGTCSASGPFRPQVCVKHIVNSRIFCVLVY